MAADRLTAQRSQRPFGSGSGGGEATIRQIHAILRASLNQAERWGLIQRNVAKLASAPAQPQHEQHPPSISDVRADDIGGNARPAVRTVHPSDGCNPALSPRCSHDSVRGLRAGREWKIANAKIGLVCRT